MVRRLVLFLLVAFIGGTALGWSTAEGAQVDVAYAACGAFTNCGTDATLTSALEVNHIEGPSAGGDPVEPDDGESWEIEAVWAGVYPSLCACTEVSSSVTADVTWTGSNWSVSCTGCNAMTGPILDVDICSGDECSDSGTHGWSYTLIVDIVENQPTGMGCARRLQRVEYTTTSIDDGHVIDPYECTEGASVSPVSEPVYGTDFGAFECAFNCNAGPATTDIVYQ